MAQGICSVETCDRVAVKWYMCDTHYNYARVHRFGVTFYVRPTDAECYWARICRAPNGCWHWTGPLNEAGYGVFRGHLAHRLMYELIMGKIDPALSLDHQCHNRDLTCYLGAACLHRRCVNPAHLIQDTQAANARRGAERIPHTHCPHGHVYDEANTGRSRKGFRYCRRCARERMRERADRGGGTSA